MGVEATEPSERELDDLAGSLAPFNPRIILTGAGFTKPWGGYLASELWSVIVSHPALRAAPETDMDLHDQLNFEETLARVQAEPETFRKENGEAILWRAVLEAFAVMDSRIARWSIEDQHTVLGDLIRDLAATAGSSTTFFFTLNQDLFVERTIPGCDGTLPPLVVPQGGGALTPGDPFGGPTKVVVPVVFDPVPFRAIKGRPGYIKLHGSMNWRAGHSDLVVLGGAKAEAIARFPILRMNNAIFRRALREKNARLLVVGYGFGDKHINEPINQAAAARNGLAIWVVDPRDPREVKHAMRNHSSLWPSVVGHSSSLTDLYGPLAPAPDRQLFHERFWK